MTEAGAALRRAESLVEIRRWEEALRALAPAAGDESTAARAHCLEAQCLLALGRHQEAERAARQALALEPDLEWGHRLLAIHDLQTRKFNRPRIRRALAHAEESVRLSPGSPNALYVLATCQLALSDKKAAAATADGMLAAAPHAPLSYVTAGRVAEARKDWDGAERHYRDGLALEPGHSELALALARLMERRGRIDEAADAYLAAGRANPTDARARRGLARLGVPVLGGGIWFVVKLLAVQGAFRLATGAGHPLPVAAAVIVGCALLAALGTLMHMRGRRLLPRQVSRGLRSDHVNYALSWLRAAAVAVAIIGIWAALIPSAKGGGAGAAVALFGFAAVALAAAGYLHRGPTTRSRAIPGWLRLPHRSRS